jgi:hypothetical protein
MIYHNTEIETFRWPDTNVQEIIDCAARHGHYMARRMAKRKNIPWGYIGKVLAKIGIPEEGYEHNNAKWRELAAWVQDADDPRAEMLREVYGDPTSAVRSRGKRGHFPVKKINRRYHFFDGPQFQEFIEDAEARLHRKERRVAQ